MTCPGMNLPEAIMNRWTPSFLTLTSILRRIWVLSGWQNIFISVPLICAGYSKVRRVPLSTNTSQPNVSLLPNHTYLRGIPSQMPASAAVSGITAISWIFYKGSGYFPEKIRSVFCVKKPCLRSSKGQPLPTWQGANQTAMQTGLFSFVGQGESLYLRSIRTDQLLQISNSFIWIDFQFYFLSCTDRIIPIMDLASTI